MIALLLALNFAVADGEKFAAPNCVLRFKESDALKAINDRVSAFDFDDHYKGPDYVCSDAVVPIEEASIQEIDGVKHLVRDEEKVRLRLAELVKMKADNDALAAKKAELRLKIKEDRATLKEITEYLKIKEGL